MDKTTFFITARAIMGGRLTQKQVDSIEAILAEADARRVSNEWLAYILATAQGESGLDYSKRENMNYSESRLQEMAADPNYRRWRERLDGRFSEYARQPKKLANLVYHSILGNGDEASGDGWTYRGWGLVQITGKDNYAKVGRLVGVDLVSDPDASLQIGLAARALIYGIRDGIYTGKKASDYLPGDYVNARRVINGTFEAQKYAGYARAFDAALVAAGYSSAPIIATIPPRAPEAATSASPAIAPQPAPETQSGLLATILRVLARIFGGKA
jgi:putative chitinase